MPKVSVIVPVYNTSIYLKDLINSLINQTLDDIEIIIIDDCSNDNSYDLLKYYSSRYPQIKLYKNVTNLGVGKTRNRGIELSSGEYIGFVDSDDYVNKNMYKTMYDVAKKYDADLVETGISMVTSDNNIDYNMNYMPQPTKRVLDDKVKLQELLMISPSSCNKLFKKELIGNYRFLENCNWEDVAFSNIMFIKAKKIVELNSLSYFYRKNIQNSISTHNYFVNDNILDIFKVTDEIVKQAKLLNKYEEYKEEINVIISISILHRVNEVNKWQIADELKRKIKDYLIVTLLDKYSDIVDIDINLLNYSVDFETMDEFKKIFNEYIKTKKR